MEIVREEVVPNLSWGTTGSHSEQIKPLMFVRHCSAQINHREQHENECL
jgi:hypothetical protein